MALGGEIQAFIIKYADNILSEIEVNFDSLSGEWLSPHNEKLIIEFERPTTIAQWGTANAHRKLRFDIVGAGLSGRYEEEKAKTILGAREEINSDFIGYLEDNEIKIMMLDANTHFYSFKKVLATS